MPQMSRVAAVASVAPPAWYKPAGWRPILLRFPVGPAAARGKVSFSLTWRLLILCFLAIAAVSIASSIVLSRSIISERLGSDARLAARLIENSVLQRHAAGYFDAQYEPTPERVEVQRFLADLIWMPDVLRAQVYSDRGTVLWSSHTPAMHQTFQGNPGLERALRGEVVIEADFLKWSSQSKPEHLFSAELKTSFVEYYLPVWNADRSRVIGAVEIYKGSQDLLTSIQQAIWRVWLCAALGGFGIFLTVVWAMRRVHRVGERQQHRMASDEGFAAMGEVAVAVAHNLRAPLGAIRTAAELLAIDARAGRSSADLCRYADDIVYDVDRLEDWIRGLLSHAHAGTQEPAAVGLNALLGRVVEAIDRKAAERKVRVDWRPGRGPDTVLAEPLLLDLVLRTLLDDALDALPEGGGLVVETGSAGRAATVVIAQSGTGMHPVPQLRDRPPGRGIGLPLVARTLERVGGCLAVRSEHWGGTRFEVSLPLDPGAR